MEKYVKDIKKESEEKGRLTRIPRGKPYLERRNRKTTHLDCLNDRDAKGN